MDTPLRDIKLIAKVFLSDTDIISEIEIRSILDNVDYIYILKRYLNQNEDSNCPNGLEASEGI